MLIIFLTVGIMIAVAGCSSDTNGNKEKSATTVEGTYNDPAKLNENITLESNGCTYNVIATEVIRGSDAAKIISKENPMIVEPPLGIEYLIVFIREQYVNGKTSSVQMGGSDFSTFCQNVECDWYQVNLPSNMPLLSGREVMAGGTNDGVLVYHVPINKEVILRFEPNKPNALNTRDPSTVYTRDPSAVYISLGNQTSSQVSSSQSAQSDKYTAWTESFQKYAPLVYLDAKTLSNDWKKSDPNVKRSEANDLVKDVQEASKENYQNPTLPEYDDTMGEWTQALTDLDEAGNSAVNIVDPAGKSGSSQDWTNIKKIDSGINHLRRAVTLFNAESGSSIELK
jgi:hypothetical protein